MKWLRNMWRRIWHTKEEIFVEDNCGKKCGAVEGVSSLSLSSAKELFSQLTSRSLFYIDRKDDNVMLRLDSVGAFINIVFCFEKSNDMLWYSGCTNDIDIHHCKVDSISSEMSVSDNAHHMILNCKVTAMIDNKFYSFPYRIEYVADLYRLNGKSELRLSI